ncbi:hypothetical protein BpOF4_21714 (plasmid) [Alkalihalophilus pseudofirmus OF4]|uniref:Uncharacterized protein n=1 Tax=Alkalihalophilus pseudofirmus (strain ATCC BAA-2126 / JCM 17055 / OF4) TaxID=398511 RepID=D3G1W2_ALKPO|nr:MULTISPECIES: hypothetical protein [Alkalihalophilus]ADC52338.1 hypothetical protein BpOF4_21714 [Alkalihalophilus pseudofirmus OF4]MED1602959.1 hypothetical protein [Alkalihalophilus marmarensis]
MKNLQERQEQGVLLFEKITPKLSDRPIEEIEELKVKQMNLALTEGISNLESSIIEIRYFSPNKITDLEIC